MRVPVKFSIDLPEMRLPTPEDTPGKASHALVCVCPNDGTLVYKAWNGLWLEAASHSPHTCDMDGAFMQKVGSV